MVDVAPTTTPVAVQLLFNVLAQTQLVDSMSPSCRLHYDDDGGQSVDMVERRTQRRTATCGGSGRRLSVMMLVIYLLLITAVIRVDAIQWL